jgi:ABC-2 type transport system permease protein
MSDWGVIRLVAGREISERIHGRLIRVMTVATALLVVAGVTIPSLIKGSSAPTRIGLVGSSAQMLAPTITHSAAAAKVKVALSDVAGQAEARTLITSGKLDAALSAAADSATVEVKSSLSATVRAVLQSVLDDEHFRATLAQTGIPAAKVLPALQPVPLTTTVLQPKPADQAARYIAAIAAGLLMYVSLALYGGAVATGVAQEKTSRTAEVLLAAVRPRQLLSGKVLGIGSIGLGQLAIAAAAGLIANAIVSSTKIPSSVVALFPAFLVCFLAGFLLYAFAFAAAGAMVSRQEEVQMVTTPIALPLLIGYLLVYAALGSPNATWLKVLSFFPPLTATLMPARIALGHVEPWELPLAALIMLASIVGMARLASRIYARGLIHSGPRLSLRGALQLSKSRA